MAKNNSLHLFKNIFFIVLLIFFFAHLGFRVFSYSKEYTTSFNPKYWEKRYLESQWIVSYSKNPIGDDGLYAYAGWKYIQGTNPILINGEMPPLGKYAIGLSILLFHNQNYFALLSGGGVLIMLYILNLSFFKDRLLAFLPIFFFSFEKLFYEQLRAPFLDLFYLLLLLFILYFAHKNKFLVSSFFLGCFAATKFPSLSVFVVASVGSWLFFLKDRLTLLKKYAVSLVLYPAVFMLSYLRYFILGNSPLAFFGAQKYIIHFYMIGAKAAIGIIFPLLFTGTWYTWFGGAQKVSEWSISWPIISLLSLGYIYLLIKEKNKEPFLLIFIWVIFYLLFLTFTPVFPRYLLLLIPFLYNLSVWVISKNIPRILRLPQ